VLTEAWGALDYADVDEREDEEVGETTDRHERAAKAAQELGEKVAIDDTAFLALLPELVGGGGSRLVQFGIGLAAPAGDRSIRWNALIGAVRNAQAGQRNYGVHCGFILGLRKAEPSLCDTLLDALIDDPILGPWLPLLQTCVPINDAGAQRLRRMLETSTIPVESYRNIANGRYLDEMKAEDFKILIDTLRKKPNGFGIACDIFSMRLHSLKDKGDDDKPLLAEAGRDLLQDIEFDSADNMQGYRLTQIAKASLHGDAGAATVTTICEKLKAAIQDQQIYRFDGDKFIRTLFEMQPIAALDVLFESEVGAMGLGHQIIRNISLNRENPLDGVPDDALIAWCNQSPLVRYRRMSRSISFSRSVEGGNQEWTSIALHMIEQAPDPAAVLSTFIERFSPSSWEGSRADHIEKRAILLDVLTGRFGPSIDAIAQAKRLELRIDVDRQREWEMSHDRGRDESFE
jgi:hypothetical protein